MNRDTGPNLYAPAPSGNVAALADVQSFQGRRGRGGNYPQTPEDWEQHRRRSAAILAQAIQDGTHSTGSAGRFLCTVRYPYHACDGIHFTETGGGQGVAGRKDYCLKCYEEMKPKADPDALESGDAAAPYIRPEPPPRRRRGAIPTLDDILGLWASVHYREAFEAYAREDNWEWEARVLAAIVRRRADLDPAWLFKLVLSRFWEDVILLAPYIKRAAGYPIDPQRMTFAQWVREVRTARAAGLI